MFIHHTGIIDTKKQVAMQATCRIHFQSNLILSLSLINKEIYGHAQ